MLRRLLACTCLVIVACGPSIEEPTEMLRDASWAVGPATTRGPTAAVCIPRPDEGTCLRITLVMGAAGEADHVGGAVVGPDCAADPEADSLVDDFDGQAFTGHGVLWLDGVAALDDGSRVGLDVEAELGDCEI